MDKSAFVSELSTRKIACRLDPGHFQKDVSLFERQIEGVIEPSTQDEVFEIVRVASRLGIALHPISGGKNWGYGTALPASNAIWILDLSRLNRILKIDLEQMAITLEPGVTQAMLHKYLEDNCIDAMTPNTGIGAHGNILGNILERGFGVAPIQDHASSILSLKACLPNGQEFQSFFRGLSGGIDGGYKWGIGPSLEPLFLQSNFAVITEATIKLAKRAERIELVAFSLKNEEKLFSAIEFGRELNFRLAGQVQAFKIFDSAQIKKTLDPQSDRLFGLDVKESRICIAVLYSNREQSRSLRKTVTRLSKKHELSGLRFFSRTRIDVLLRIASSWPFSYFLNRHLRSLNSLSEYMRLAEGHPSSIGLNILYPELSNQALESVDPAGDEKTIIWYAPIMPMKGTNVVRAIKCIASVTERAGLSRPSMTITCVSDATAAITVPLTFRSDERAMVYQLYRELLSVGAKEGFFPYRVPIEFMKDLVQYHPQYWEHVNRVKEAFDPKSTIAPGRYSVA